MRLETETETGSEALIRMGDSMSHQQSGQLNNWTWLDLELELDLELRPGYGQDNMSPVPD